MYNRLLLSSAGTMKTSLPVAVTAPRWMMNGFWLFWPVKYGLSFRMILIYQEPIVLSWVPPDATPPRPSAVRQAAIGCAVVGAAVGIVPAITEPQARPFASKLTSSVSALPFRVSSDRQAPAKVRAWLVAGGPCQSVKVKVPGCASPELSTANTWLYGGVTGLTKTAQVWPNRSAGPGMGKGPAPAGTPLVTPSSAVAPGSIWMRVAL